MNNLYIKYNYKYFLMQITVIVECNNNFSKLNIVIKEDNTYWQLEFIITNWGGGGGGGPGNLDLPLTTTKRIVKYFNKICIFSCHQHDTMLLNKVQQVCIELVLHDIICTT